MADNAQDIAANRARSRAMPMFGPGYLPPERKPDADTDNSGFRDVLYLFLRSWPYIRYYFLGRWWIPGKGIGNATAEVLASEGYSFAYAPFLVCAVAFAGPATGYVPATLEWPWFLMYIPTASIAVSMFGLAFAPPGRWQMTSIAATILSGIGVVTFSGFFMDGWPPKLYGTAVLAACIFGWTVQFRIRHDGETRLEFRVRAATHLVYFYAINFGQRFLGLALGLILGDLINQNLLQGEPLAPSLQKIAMFFGVPEWAYTATEELTREQKVELMWLYVKIELLIWVTQSPISTFVNPYYNLWIMQHINQDLRVALVERWHQLSMSYHSGHRTGDSIFRIYQDSAMVTSVIGHLLAMTLATGSYLTCVVLVTLLSPWLGLMAATLLIPGFMWAYWAMPRMRVRALAYRGAASDVTATIQETFGAMKLIKAFGTKERAQKRFEDDAIIAFNAAYRVRILIAYVTIVMYTLAASFFIGGEFAMAMWSHRGDPMFATQLVGLLGLSYVVWNLATFRWAQAQFGESSGDIRWVLRGWMMAQDMAMGLRRVFDILDLEPDVKDRPGAVPMTRFEREIRFENVRFAYEPGRPVLDNASFAATPGSITAIIGPTGSGKSTLMALLLRLYDTQAGTISIDGRDVRDYLVETLRANIAIALQENVLFAMSVRDNIRYVAPGADDAAVREAVRVACMDDYVNSLPRGLDTVLSDRGGKLSTGQRQRLSIARAVVRDTPILALDEPTAALDAATERKVMTNLAEWGRERAIFVITHRISTIRLADNIVYLDGGRIVESGDHETLMGLEGGRYRAFVDAESNLAGTA
ncbi:MAG: ABC transporter ATP-binding protein [Gammaproteobacteria bacterium]|nr:ABC transporter ATP-binding protein [Gammaproteobacteria bacterium]